MEGLQSQLQVFLRPRQRSFCISSFRVELLQGFCRLLLLRHFWSYTNLKSERFTSAVLVFSCEPLLTCESCCCRQLASWLAEIKQHSLWLVGTIFLNSYWSFDLPAETNSCCCCRAVSLFWPLLVDFLINGNAFALQIFLEVLWHSHESQVLFWGSQVTCDRSNWLLRLLDPASSCWPCNVVASTDVYFTDEDTKSILTDKVKRTIQGKMAMQL